MRGAAGTAAGSTGRELGTSLGGWEEEVAVMRKRRNSSRTRSTETCAIIDANFNCSVQPAWKESGQKEQLFVDQINQRDRGRAWLPGDSARLQGLRRHSRID